MSDTPTASPVVLGRWEKPGNLASIAALAAAGQVTILPNELIRTTDGRVYHWTTSALEIVSAPVHHGTVADVAALDGIYLLPSCTRGVHPGDTAYVTAAGCEYRVTSGINATAIWAACTTLPTIPTTPSEVGADPSGTAATAVSTHNTATDSHTDLRELIAGKQASGNYAGSATAGGAASSAVKLATARSIKLDSFGTYTSDPTFDGTGDATLCVPRAYSSIADFSMAGVAAYGNSMGMVFASDSPFNPAGEWGRFLQMSFSDQWGNAWQTQIFQRGTTGEITLRSQQGGQLGQNFGPWYSFLTAGSHPNVAALESVSGATQAVPLGNSTLIFDRGLFVSRSFNTRSAPVFIGDSITYGAGAQPNMCWIDSALLGLGVVLHSNFVYNYGVGGERSDQINARLPALLTGGHRHVIYMAGTNDAYQSVPLATYAQNVQNAISLCNAAGAKIYVCCPIPSGAASGSVMSRLIEVYRIWLSENVEGLGGKFVDTYSLLLDQSTGYLRSSYDYDGVHPNLLGHNEIANSVVNALKADFQNDIYLGAGAGRVNYIPDPTNASSGPLATGWELGSNYGVTQQPSIISDSSGLLSIGRWQEFFVTASSAGYCNYIMRPSPQLDIVAQHYYAVSFCIQVEDVGGGYLQSVSSGNSSIQVLLMQGSTVAENVILARTPARAHDSVYYNGSLQYVFMAGSSFSDVYLLVSITLGNALSVKLRIGRMSIIDLTENGLI